MSNAPLILAFMLAIAQGPAPRYCPHPVRHRAAVHRFERQTGYPHGRPGYVVDHIVPLCACGADATSNMQWQRADSAAIKDRTERTLCAKLRKAAR